MKRITAVMAGLVALLAVPAIADAAGSAGYPVADLSITTSTSQAAPGGSVGVQGDGADAGSPVKVYLTCGGTERLVASTTASGAGTFSATFAIPAGTPNGVCTGAVVASMSSVFVKSTFSVTVSSGGGLPATGGEPSSLLRFAGLTALLGAAGVAFAARRRAVTA